MQNEGWAEILNAAVGREQACRATTVREYSNFTVLLSPPAPPLSQLPVDLLLLEEHVYEFVFIYMQFTSTEGSS